MVAYKLILSEFSKAKLAIEPLEFTRCFSGSLKFRDSSGVQYVRDSKHSNLEVFQVNDHILCIVEEDQYSKPEIYNALREFHSKNIDQEIERLKKIKKNL